MDERACFGWGSYYRNVTFARSFHDGTTLRAMYHSMVSLHVQLATETYSPPFTRILLPTPLLFYSPFVSLSSMPPCAYSLDP